MGPRTFEVQTRCMCHGKCAFRPFCCGAYVCKNTGTGQVAKRLMVELQTGGAATQLASNHLPKS